MAEDTTSTTPITKQPSGPKGETTYLLRGIKKVNVQVCSSGKPDEVQGLVDQIKEEMGDVVDTVVFRPFPYNLSEMDEFDLSKTDVLLLCHSIDNRRLSLTDVTDALYDRFFPKVRKTLGKSKLMVIAHDLRPEDLEPEIVASKMQSLQSRQKTTFENSSLVLLGGKLKTSPVELKKEQMTELKRVLAQAATPPLHEKVEVYWFGCCPKCMCCLPQCFPLVKGIYLCLHCQCCS